MKGLSAIGESHAPGPRTGGTCYDTAVKQLPREQRIRAQQGSTRDFWERADQLMRAVAGADEEKAAEAFNQLYSLVRPRILWWFRKKQRGDAEDLTEEVLLRTWSGRDSYNPERPAYPWIVSIASNLRTDVARGEVRKRQPKTRNAELKWLTESPPERPEELAVEDGWIGAFQEGLRRLREAHRDHYDVLEVEMKDSDPDRSDRIAYIATQLSIKTGTAGSRRNRALAELKEILAGLGFRWLDRAAELPAETEIVLCYDDRLLIYSGPS